MSFPLGQIVSTPGALKALEKIGQIVLPYLVRHGQCDWGDIDAEDRAENELGLKEGFRLMSSYKINEELTIWIITEADRSSTCVLLP